MGMRSPTVWGFTALAFPTHSPCGATVGCFLWQVLDFKPGSSSTTEQAALNNHLGFEGVSLSTGSCCRAPDAKQPVPGLLCDTTVYHRTCHGFFAPGFQPSRAFSVYQWKSELCPTSASSPMTYTFPCVLDPLVMGGTESTFATFLDNGDPAGTQALLGVIRKGGWTHSWSNSSHGRIQNLPSAFPSTHSKICN